jgi:hypothetical protein
MKQRNLPHRLFAPALALPDISLNLPFNPAMTISSTWKSIRQNGPAKRDLHRRAIQREHVFDRQSGG